MYIEDMESRAFLLPNTWEKLTGDFFSSFSLYHKIRARRDTK